MPRSRVAAPPRGSREGQRSLNEKLALQMEHHPVRRADGLQQENRCHSTPVGASTSKSIFYPASQQHLLIFQQLTALPLRRNIWDEA